MSLQLAMGRKKPQLPTPRRSELVGRLFMATQKGALPRGTVPMVSEDLGIHRATAYRIYARAKQGMANGNLDVTARKARCGRKSKWDIPALQGQLEEIPLERRTTMRDAAKAIGIPLATFHRLMKTENLAICHRNSTKPTLTDQNKKERVEYVCRRADIDTGFIDELDDVIHLNEKWFYIMDDNQKYYITEFEEKPHRTTKHKRFVAKVMVLCAVARPRFDPDTGRFWDGKIGVYAFVVEHIAQRNSVNRPAGTVELRNHNVTRDVYRKTLIEKVLPDIRRKWPRSFFEHQHQRSRVIYLQQDNAKPHIKGNDTEFCAAARIGGWKIEMTNQPPNLPDLNVLNLGLFNALDKIQKKTKSKNIEQLVTAVTNAFDELPWETINDCFLTLQAVFSQILLKHGNNDYSLPHIGKKRLARAGILPRNLLLSEAAMEAAYAFTEPCTCEMYTRHAAMMRELFGEDEDSDDEE